MEKHEVILAVIGRDHEGSVLFALTRKSPLANANPLVVEAKAALSGLREAHSRKFSYYLLEGDTVTSNLD
ncbi:hypothetical protein TorRG33x02_185740 [Trema orientale]|uniref:RNase H type-1 domain-containing protein n=1 Tax=Trema orientale TaxID=63057 RepID=A0A2P5EJ84_TREOI|nr:hypothetical protein TorRG33x02_185740 [Trema orientale]